MGTNSPYFPDSVRSDEEAIVYLGMMVLAMKSQTYVAKTGAGPFTLTAAEMVGGVVDFSGSTTAVTVNTATAAQIIAQMQALDANAGVGSTANFSVVNNNTSAGALTITPGTGVSLAGSGTPGSVPISTARRYQIKVLTSTTVSLTPVG